jgi:DNA-binding LytR/AlgR family response regulator
MYCIIIDGEPSAVEQLTDYLHKTPGIGLLASFYEAQAAIGFLNRHPIDFVLLAVDLPAVNGFRFYEQSRQRPPVIFMGSNAAQAAECYNLNAIDFLLKPVSLDRFRVSIARMQQHILQNRLAFAPIQLPEHSFINLKSGTKLYHVKIADIQFLEKAGNYLSVFTRTQKILIRENMEGILAQLPAAFFVRVHKSYIVSVLHIDIIESHQLHIGSHIIPVAQAYKEVLKKMLDNPTA